MKNPLIIRSPLHRDGTSQRNRFPADLAPDRFPIDGRTLEELLHFTERFASQLQYYTTAGLPDGDWTSFVERDCSFVLASIIRAPLDLRREEWEALYLAAETHLSRMAKGIPVPDTELTQSLLNLIEFLQKSDYYSPSSTAPTLFRLAERWHQFTTDATNFRADLSASLLAELSGLLHKTAHIHFELAHLWVSGAFPTLLIADYAGYSPGYLGDLEAYLTELSSGLPIVFPLYVKGNTALEQMNSTLLYLKQVFDALMGQLSHLQLQARAALAESLSNYDQHEPQVGLFITFLRLFQFSQQQLNTLTRDHLRFFFTEVLRQSEQGPQADTLHAIFRLKPGSGKVLLPKGTELSAGKDPSGANRIYKTEEEHVLNEGTVTSLKTLFREAAPAASHFPSQGSRLFVAQTANSPKGEGKPTQGISWPLLGSPQSHLPKESRTMADAVLGYSIASPQLALQGGSRSIRLIHLLQKGSKLSSLSDHQLAHAEAALVSSLRIRLSGAKSWIEKQPSRVCILNSNLRLAGVQLASDVLRTQLVTREGTSGHPWYTDLYEEVGDVDFSLYDCLIVEVMLSPADEAVVPYSSKLGKEYTTQHPVAELLLDNHGLTIAAEALPEVNLTAPRFAAACLLQGNIYEPIGAEIRRSITIEEYFSSNIPAFGDRVSYNVGDRVRYDGKIYGALWNSTSPIPEGAPDHWDDIAAVPPIPFASDYDPLRKYLAGQYANYHGRVYRALRNSISPLPDTDPQYWQELNYTCNLYDILEGCVPSSLRIKVMVYGLNHLVVENEFGTMRPDKPFEPFGFRPQSGARFYVGSGEAFAKKLSQLTLHLKWRDIPSSLAAHYANYPSPPDNTDYKCKLDLLQDGNWSTLHPGGTMLPALFDGTIASNPKFFTTQLTSASEAGQLNLLKYDRHPTVLPSQRLAPGASRGFLRVELVAPAMGFGHLQYADLYTKAVAASPSSPALPAEPYTPRLDSVQLSYSSTVEVPLDARAPSAFTHRVEQFHHVTPFGKAERHLAQLRPGTLLHLLPGVEAEGQLLIGLSDLEGGSTLSLLFQLLEGSGDAEMPRKKVRWQVLGSSEWMDLSPSAIVRDSSLDLVRSGIVQFDIPLTASRSNGMMPTGLIWIRALMPEATAAMHKGISILAQAVAAKFHDQGNDPGHYLSSLPANSVTGMVNRLPVVREVSQPFSSFGARPAEDETRFLTRVSERLRHKGRSVTVWDYERIALESHPQLFKVKCIPHALNDCEIHPGDVTVVTVPDVRRHNGQNPFEPRTSLDVLEQVRRTLVETVSPMARVKVCNPLYEQVRISAGIGFRPGFDPGYHTALLVQDLQRFLSPWAFEEGREIMFGGRIHRSVILHFIEERPYVDYVVKFRMDHLVEDGPENANVREAVTTTARSVLVTAPHHQLVPVNVGDYDRTGSPYHDGIGYWIIPADFRVS
jgi:hypothetical protein